MRRISFILMIILIISTIGQARDISVTVYNQNIALVHDVREIEFAKGVFMHSFTDIPSRIDPTSVHFKANKVTILEQNYEFDLASVEKIMQKYIGSTVRVFVEDGNMFEGRLQSFDGANVILVDGSGTVKVIQGGKIVHGEYPEMPADFIEKPTLIWSLYSDAPGSRKAEVSYLTYGMDWHAEYVGVVKGLDKLDFSGWVSVENRSGITYDKAKLKLMAGDIHLAPVPTDGRARFLTSAVMAEKKDLQFEEKEFFEYHLYTLQRPATLKNNQIKQISLFPEAEAKCSRLYLYDSRRSNTNIVVSLEFRNSKSDGLGLPLPAGKVRIYQEDDDGSLEFIGEDNITHTPKDEKLSIQVGKAFDIVGERNVADTRMLGRYDWEEDIEIKLRNHKKEKVQITVRERLYGNWKIIKNSHDYNKIDAYTIEFKVDTPPHGPEEELTISYTVHYSRQ
ncbi:MAG: DUF4139 domain-containing protein [FCB group bacterium]|nr:DUF4139 domain-containing protein [FCB group bacterium]